VAKLGEYFPLPKVSSMTDTTHSGFGKYPLHLVALGLLMPGPKHGYGLYQDFVAGFSTGDSYGAIWKAGQTKFYVTLTDLEKEGFLESSMEPQENRPPRKVYHLTDAGRSHFLDWLHKPVRSMRSIRVEFIAKLRFFDLLNLPGAGDLLDAQIEVFHAMLDEWENPAPVGEVDPFFEIVGDFRKRQVAFLIEWLAACKGRVSQ
jgi:DNA-binding PadR family transcriptional regulator